MMKEKITSLADLKVQKKKLRMEIELSKREFAHSLGTSRATLSSFLLKKVAIPAGAAGLGIAGISKLMSSDEKVIAQQSKSLLPTLLPILITAFQTLFLKNKVDEN